MKINELTNESFIVEFNRSAYKAAARNKVPASGIGSWFTKVYTKIGKNQRRTDIITKMWMSKWGGFVTFLRVIQVVAPAIELYCQLDFAQEMRDGKVEGHELSEEDYKDLEETLWGLFVVQELTPIAMRIVKSVFLINWVLRIIKWVAGGISAGVTAGATVALVVATELFQIWLQQWITSDAGIAWLEDHFLLPIIKGIGWAPTALHGLIDEYKKSHTDKETDNAVADKPTSSSSSSTTSAGASGQKDDKADPANVDKTSKTDAGTSSNKTTDTGKTSSGMQFFKKDALPSPEEIKRKEAELQLHDKPGVKTTIDPKTGKLDVGMRSQFN